MFSFRIEVLQDDRVRYANQPIALAVAETLEAATEGARLLAPVYEAEPARIGFDRGEPLSAGVRRDRCPGPPSPGTSTPAWRPPPAGSRPRFETPMQYHNAMEPHASSQAWDGARLDLDTPNQAIAMGQAAFAAFFGIPTRERHAEKSVHRRRLRLQGDPLRPLRPRGALAARTLGRPVRLVFPPPADGRSGRPPRRHPPAAPPRGWTRRDG